MKEIVVCFLILLGALFQLLAAIGILKFPKFLIRLHASSKASTMGLGCYLLAAGLYLGEPADLFKCGLAAFFFFFTAPAVAFVLAKVELGESNEKNTNEMSFH